MENYNPRQPTRFRFKDSREMEKFNFTANLFDFKDEILEHVRQDDIYKHLIDILMKTYKKAINIPLIIYDETNENLFIGYVDGMIYTGYANNGPTQIVLELTYDPDTDKLQVVTTDENFISEDNVKTLFGNQSIIGQGNIDLYRHQLTLNYDGEYETLSLIVYSSSNLNVDSLQDLTTLLKPNSNTLYYGNTINALNTYTFQIIYDNNVWKTGPISEATGKPDNNITAVSDIITTI